MKNSKRAALVGAAAVVLGAFAGVASASTIGINNGALDVGSGGIAAPVCAAGQLAMNGVRVTYAANVYSISQVDINTLNANCQQEPFQVAVANNVAGYSSIFEGSGTTPNGTGVFTFGSGGNVNLLNSTNNQVRVFMVVLN